jgi:hypothetical protein
MEQPEKNELSDRELDALLVEWRSPKAPAHLRAALFPEVTQPWWLRVCKASIRVPLPLAACLAVVLSLAAWRWSVPAPARVEIRTQRVEVPVVQERVVTKTVYRDRVVPSRASETASNMQGLQPVAELRPRIIRRGNDQN